MASSSERESPKKDNTLTALQRISRSFSEAFSQFGRSSQEVVKTFSEFSASLERISVANGRLRLLSDAVTKLGETEDDMANTNLSEDQLALGTVDYASIITDSPQLGPITISDTITHGNTSGDYQWTYISDSTGDPQIEEWPSSQIHVSPLQVSTTTPPWVWTHQNFTQGDANMREVELLGELSKITGLDFRSMLSLFTRVGSTTKVQRERAIEQYSHAITQFAVDGQFNVWERDYAILMVRGRNSGYFLFGKDSEPTNDLEFEIHKMTNEVSTIRKIRVGPFIPEEREKVKFQRIEPIVCPDTEYTIYLYNTDEDLYVREGNFYRKKED